MRSRLVAAGLLTFALWPRLAAACWDGYTASLGSASLSRATGEGDWSPARARTLARVLTQLAVLVPPGTLFAVDPYGYVSLCPEDEQQGPCIEHESRWEGGELTEVLSLAAKLLHSDAATLRRAQQTRSRPVYTVQAVATQHLRGASAVAQRLNDRDNPSLHGFYVDGGFPAWNEWAHVVPGRSPSGGEVFRVWAGAFLEPSEAEEAAREVARITGLAPYVRRL